MKKLFLIAVVLLLFSSFAFADLESARLKWLEAKETHLGLQQEWRQAQLLVAANNTQENIENVIEKAKAALNAGLDEAIAFFEFHKEKLTSADVSDELKATIESDLNKNIDVAEGLKDDVNAITTRAEVGVVSLKIIDAYLNLLVDVMRDTGLVFVEKANLRVEKLEEFRDTLQEKVDIAPEDKKEDLDKLMESLNVHIDEAKSAIDSAEEAYNSITKKEGSRIAFEKGNTLIRQSRSHMVLAFQDIRQIVKKLRE